MKTGIVVAITVLGQKKVYANSFRTKCFRQKLYRGVKSFLKWRQKSRSNNCQLFWIMQVFFNPSSEEENETVCEESSLKTYIRVWYSPTELSKKWEWLSLVYLFNHNEPGRLCETGVTMGSASYTGVSNVRDVMSIKKNAWLSDIKRSDSLVCLYIQPKRCMLI